MLSVSFAGNVGQDAETKDVDGTPVTKFSVATHAYVNGEKTTQWMNVNFWGKRGESLAQYLTEGKSVFVRGSMTVRQYTTKDDESRVSCDVRADEVELLSGGGQRSEKEERPAKKPSKSPPPKNGKA